jgi:hypothetical protein
VFTLPMLCSDYVWKMRHDKRNTSLQLSAQSPRKCSLSERLVVGTFLGHNALYSVAMKQETPLLCAVLYYRPCLAFTCSFLSFLPISAFLSWVISVLPGEFSVNSLK